MWHAYEDVFCDFWLSYVAFLVATMVCSFFFLHVFTLWFIIPQFVQHLLVFLILLCVFTNVAYLVFCGIESAFLISTVVMSFSHNIITSLCCCSVDRFILIISIMRYDCKPILNIVVKKLFVVGTYKPWTNFWTCS